MVISLLAFQQETLFYMRRSFTLRAICFNIVFALYPDALTSELCSKSLHLQHYW